MGSGTELFSETSNSSDMRQNFLLGLLCFLEAVASAQSQGTEGLKNSQLVLSSPAKIDFQADGAKKYLEAIKIVNAPEILSESDKGHIVALILTMCYGAHDLGNKDLTLNVEAPIFQIINKNFPEIASWDRSGEKFLNPKEVKFQSLEKYFQEYALEGRRATHPFDPKDVAGIAGEKSFPNPKVALCALSSDTDGDSQMADQIRSSEIIAPSSGIKLLVVEPDVRDSKYYEVVLDLDDAFFDKLVRLSQKKTGTRIVIVKDDKILAIGKLDQPIYVMKGKTDFSISGIKEEVAQSIVKALTP